MKIVEVNAYHVRPRWGFVEIITDEGITGWGEAVLEGHCDAVLACVQEYRSYLIGQDPFRIEDISANLSCWILSWRRCFNECSFRYRSSALGY